MVKTKTEKPNIILMLKQIFALTVQYRNHPSLVEMIQDEINSDIGKLENK